MWNYMQDCINCNKTKETLQAKKLLRCVSANDINGLKKLFEINSNLINYEYSDHYENQKIFHIACNDLHGMANVNKETLEKLIQFNANYLEPNNIDHWEPLHYTALTANLEKMQFLTTIIQEKVYINSLVICSKHITAKYPFCQNFIENSYSNNALMILLKYGNRERDFYECCQLLVDKGIDVHQKDSNGLSSINLSEIMEDDQLKKIILSSTAQTILVNPVFDTLKLKQEEAFLALKTKNVDDLDGSDEYRSSCTLLQLSCLNGLKSCVEYLLKHGASPNKTIVKNTSPPIIIAIKGDHEDIVHLLLANKNLELPKDILINLQLKYENIHNFMKIDKYMELMLQHLQRSNNENYERFILEKDKQQRTALHYAIHFQCSDNILDLLSMGASLIEKDIFGYTPMDSIKPDILKKFLDNCIDLPKDENLNNMLYNLRNKKHKFAIEINYKSLVKTNVENESHESEFLDHMIKSKKIMHLLNHPVVSSYIAVKWQKFKWIVYINLFLYLLSYISLLIYGSIFDIHPKLANNLLLMSLLLLILRELVQFTIFRSSYLTRMDNILDLFLISGIIYIIASGWIQTLLNQNLLVAFSVVFLTSTLGIFLQLGYLPLFAIKVLIFKQILINFGKYMLFYMFPLLAFFFCFHMLMEDPKGSNISIYKTLYVTITMFAGDPQSDYPKAFKTNPIFGHIIYVVFIILIGIILHNLLIGLAVQDLQEIQKEAEFVDKIERVSYITSIEKIIFQKYQKSNFIFRSMFRKLLKTGNIFHEKRILVIQPYNSGCVYVKDKENIKEHITDHKIIALLQTFFKDLTMQNQVEAPYSPKNLYKKMVKIETLLSSLKLESEIKQTC